MADARTVDSLLTELSALKTQMALIREKLRSFDHGDDCSRVDECENIEFDSKARYHCAFHGEDQCPPCDCGLGELRELVR